MIPDDFECSSLALPGDERVVEDFQNTFKIVYASVIDGPFNFDPQTLTSALCIATAYDHPGLRAFSIQHLEAAALGAVERIRLAREFGIGSWEDPAFAELYKRDEAITLEEAAVLGLETFVQVARAREQEHRCKCSEHLQKDTKTTEVQPDTTHATNPVQPTPAHSSRPSPRKAIDERLAALRAKQSARRAHATQDSVNY
ncbi:hypothetical protein FRC06_010803 [Ceratobasidium sp. 370]|nr:hypothetical protein FRC06_010803 [Ceratobasidium sp. 370]